MEKIDDLTRGRLREWQMRRLEIKDQMQSAPERTLELSRVLDLMDDEHAEILAASTRTSVPDSDPATEPPSSGGDMFGLQLNICANSAEDMRRLLDMAVHEVQREIDAGDQRRHSGGMSGSLGDYRFELGLGRIVSKDDEANLKPDPRQN